MWRIFGTTNPPDRVVKNIRGAFSSKRRQRKPRGKPAAAGPRNLGAMLHQKPRETVRWLAIGSVPRSWLRDSIDDIESQ